jgi:cytochrome b561
MPIRNTENRYGIMAISVHWIMAILVIGMLVLGLYMARLPISLQKLKLYGWHKEVGILILMLVCFRLGWRMANVTPPLPGTLAWVQRVAAHMAHYALYALMILMPITGWMISSAADLPVSFFGLFTLPDIVSPSETLRVLMQSVHEWLGYALIAVITMHASAALQHHFYYKDNILRRMLP